MPALARETDAAQAGESGERDAGRGGCVQGVNGATAIGARSRFPDRRKAGDARLTCRRHTAPNTRHSGVWSCTDARCHSHV